MKESNVWHWLDSHKPKWLEIERIEVLYPPGLSDCFWTDRRTLISGWLELKYSTTADKELRRGLIPKLKPTQPMFLNRQARKGIPAGILLRIGDEYWRTYRATGDPEWANEIRSTRGFEMCDDQWFKPTVDQIFQTFVQPRPL